ncbi:outer membrane beta-barrel protein [Verrucomicrobiaceae bacterium N1E253]|uniref:Outer membrane beta-barrel protein n=1 Tax=Oceaniferula marina TaxID=2748318 RepID=A0A851GKH2_9BACT|nr:outer membrane beta-barrel protein [Oceaniferula marina]NWK54664.1 outer membrane beta-barrel protein [Oceaniferula marina]
MKKTSLALISLAPLTALAGEAIQTNSSTYSIQSEHSEWYYRVALYGWGQSLDGDIGVMGQTAAVDVDFSDLVEDLEIGLMGAVEIGKGRWSVLLDLNYADLSDEISTPNSKIDFEQEQLVGNLVLNYQAINSDVSKLTLFGGIRGNWLDVNMSYTGGPLKDRTLDEDKSWADPIIGLRYRQDLGSSIYLRALGDVGGFGVSSDFTWQAMAGLGWQFNPCGGLFLGYRAIGTDYEDGGFTYDLSAHGPMIGLEYKF